MDESHLSKTKINELLNPRDPRSSSQLEEIRKQSEKDIRAVREQINAIDVQIRDLKDKREKLVSERDRISRRMAEPARGGRAPADNVGVAASLLVPYIEEWVSEYDEVHGKGGYKMLAILSNTNVRNIRTMRNGEQQWVSLKVADRLMTAMMRQDVLREFPLLSSPINIHGHNSVKPLIPERPINVYSDT